MPGMQMERLYQEIILDHSRAPHHAGLREPFDAQVHQVNPTCGDEVTVRVALDGAGPDTTVTDISHESLGCSISQASTSMMTDLLIGRSRAEALAVLGSFEAMVTSKGADPGDEDVLGDAVAFAGVAQYPNRVKCALLGWMAFKQAVLQASSDETVPSMTSDHAPSGE